MFGRFCEEYCEADWFKLLNPIMFWDGILLLGGEGDTLARLSYCWEDPFPYALFAYLVEGEGLTLLICELWSTFIPMIWFSNTKGMFNILIWVSTACFFSTTLFRFSKLIQKLLMLSSINCGSAFYSLEAKILIKD